MDVRMAYCSACDRNVRVVHKPGVDSAGKPAAASDLVCLEYGESCTGDLCPLFDIPSEQMRKNLDRPREERGRPSEGDGS